MTGKADRLQDRLSFSEIDHDTVTALAEYKPHLVAVLPGILEKFYAHLKRWPHLAAMFQDEPRMNRTRKAQESHWLKLFDANFDDAYIQSVHQIGTIHSRIGLEPSWYMGAYAYTLNYLYADVMELYRDLPDREEATEKTGRLIRAINQCAILDMDIAISTYLQENKATYDRKLESLVERFQEGVGQIIEDLAHDSSKLEENAESLTATALQTSNDATSIAVATQQATTNVNSVSSATEGMSASIANLETMSKASLTAAREAAEETGVSMGRILDLNTAIHKISEITNLIASIAQQTNLLALNATIEAARANEAGRGFAVVAKEVKNLATETTQATEDIRAQIDELSDKSEATVASIKKVRGVIQNVNSVSDDTAESISKQKLAVHQIVNAVGRASVGTTEISHSIGTISSAALETGKSASDVLAAASRLSDRNRMLKGAVLEFIDELKK